MLINIQQYIVQEITYKLLGSSTFYGKGIWCKGSVWVSKLSHLHDESFVFDLSLK